MGPVGYHVIRIPAGTPGVAVEHEAKGAHMQEYTPYQPEVPHREVPHRPGVPWSPRDVWLGVLAVIVILAAAWGLALLLASLSAADAPDLWIVLFPAVFELLFLVPVWWFTKHKYGATLRDLGFVGFKPSSLAVGVALLIAVYFVIGLYSLILARYGLRAQSDLSPVLEELESPWALFFVMALVAPVVEEVFFRGFVFAGLRGRYGWGAAAVISSVMFAVFHLELTFVVPAFLLGFLFAYVYHRANSIWPSMILHVMVNGLAVAAYYIQLSQ